jgi:hypothetical protein
MMLQVDVDSRGSRAQRPRHLALAPRPDSLAGFVGQAWLNRTQLSRTSSAPVSDVAGTALHRRYLAMLDEFEATGGVVTGDELAMWARSWTDQPMSVVARWLVRREVTHFKWQGATYIPLFQFDCQGKARRDGLQDTISQLACAFDDWEMAEWFALPNVWLGDASPASRLAHDTAGVLGAACADRFVAMG